MKLKPLATEKAVKLIDIQNTLAFETGRRERKENIKKEIESVFNVKIESLRTLVRKNKKLIYAKLTKDYPAIDVATRLGMI